MVSRHWFFAKRLSKHRLIGSSLHIHPINFRLGRAVFPSFATQRMNRPTACTYLELLFDLNYLYVLFPFVRSFQALIFPFVRSGVFPFVRGKQPGITGFCGKPTGEPLSGPMSILGQEGHRPAIRAARRYSVGVNGSWSRVSVFLLVLSPGGASGGSGGISGTTD